MMAISHYGKVRGWRLQLTSSCGAASSPSEPPGLRPLAVCDPEHTDACPSSSSLAPSRLFPRLGIFTHCDRVLPYLAALATSLSLACGTLRAPVQNGARGTVLQCRRLRPPVSCGRSAEQEGTSTGSDANDGIGAIGFR